MSWTVPKGSPLYQVFFKWNGTLFSHLPSFLADFFEGPQEKINRSPQAFLPKLDPWSTLLRAISSRRCFCRAWVSLLPVLQPIPQPSKNPQHEPNRTHTIFWKPTGWASLRPKIQPMNSVFEGWPTSRWQMAQPDYCTTLQVLIFSIGQLKWLSRILPFTSGLKARSVKKKVPEKNRFPPQKKKIKRGWWLMALSR